MNKGVKVILSLSLSMLALCGGCMDSGGLGVAGKVGARPVIVPLYVGGAPGADDYCRLVDCWVNGLVDAAKKAGYK